MKNHQAITYRIADIRLRMDTPWKETVSKAFYPFVEETGEYDWRIKFRPVRQLQQFLGKPLFCNDIFRIYQESSGIFVRQYYNDRPDASAYLSVYPDTSKKEVSVEYLPEAIGRFGSGERDFFSIGLEKILIEEHAMVLHAALVNTPYGGILFSGPSGAGKSTQAELWCTYGQGRLLNGDRPILKKTEDGFRAYGSPYAGSSGCHLAESCRIRAIVLVRQSKRCALRRVRGTESFRRVFENLTINIWDKDFVARAGDMTLQLVSEIAVWELWCTKDRDAVSVLQKLLENDNDQGTGNQRMINKKQEEKEQ